MSNQQTEKEALNPKFEGFFIEMVMPDLEDRCQEVVVKILGEGWKVTQIGDNLTEFEIILHDDALSSKQAWDKTYELRSQPGVVDVEPLFTVPVQEKQVELQAELVPTKRDISLLDLIFSFLDRLLDLFVASRKQGELQTNDVNWTLKELKVFQAWERYFPDPNKPPGHGIIIAHPDTGYTTHPEIVDNLLLEEGYDFVGSDEDETDPLEKSDTELVNNPGHGTSTASVMVSPPGAQANYDNGKYVTGVAPGAKLVPLRISYSVVLLSNRNLAQAIEYAADKGFHIVSISLGAGFYNKRLRSAIVYAQKRGVIIIAASGTWVPYVIFPAAYDEVIAVCGSTIEGKIWWGASRGKKVDVSAPGKGVWYARSVKENGNLKYRIDQGEGTSFSAPLVAGVAALWLSYHGRDRLIQRYGAEKIPFIFNQLLRDTCDVPPNWKPNRYGAGIVNAAKLLDAPLPDNVNRSVIPPAFALQQHTLVESGELDTFAHLFEPQEEEMSINSLNSQLAELLQTTETELPKRLKEVGQELSFYFAANRELYEKFAKSLNQDKGDRQQPATREFQTLAVQPSDSGKEMRDMLLNLGVSDNLNRKLEN
ncbi:S8/S53 family peptidase [Rivularia sp. UHCC 0363]|uniref:S8 family peptidase n=1 Tax=Rivularia sp. UHCC 0363 TaxID=3110244 RepID=UPI002B1F967C|nr:S8/S53 family peptidase [Rivularia sp. UHCC 0363]MEA5597985.1 S8/S53 family peptidase [Rivularia sp. UHCC 0363]